MRTADLATLLHTFPSHGGLILESAHLFSSHKVVSIFPNRGFYYNNEMVFCQYSNLVWEINGTLIFFYTKHETYSELWHDLQMANKHWIFKFKSIENLLELKLNYRIWNEYVINSANYGFYYVNESTAWCLSPIYTTRKLVYSDKG